MRGGHGEVLNEKGSLDEVDPFFMALLRSRQRRFVECIDVCTEILAVNPYDQVCPIFKVGSLPLPASCLHSTFVLYSVHIGGVGDQD